MRQMRLIFFVGLCAIGCAGYAERKTEKVNILRKQVAFDWSCPATQLEPSEIAPSAYGPEFTPGTYGVTGCGKKSTYIWNRIHGSWVLNSSQ
jgi:hypothetical protein